MKKPVSVLILLSIIFLISCMNTQKTANEEEKPDKMENLLYFYLGTYTQGESDGIYKYKLSDSGKVEQVKLVAKSENPSFLALTKDNKFLLAVNENENGTIESYKITGDSLELINSGSTGGAHPCFVAVNDQNYSVSANYTGGNVALHKLSPKGKLSKLLFVEQHTGKGTTPRQQAPYAHSAWFKPGTNEVIAADLGTNELWISELDTDSEKLIPQTDKKLLMPQGAGPRHLCFHPQNDWFYVINELKSTVSLVKEKDGKYFVESSISTLPEDFTEQNTCADIHISPEGKFLYASNRGHNSLAIFKIDQTGGRLSLVAHESVKGEGPRNFAVSPCGKFILVANQYSGNIVSFKRDSETGLLQFVSECHAPTPVCIKFEY